MNTTYEIPLIVNCQYHNELMNKMIDNLEYLEVMKVNVFNRLNQALFERVTKLENLKSRINRAINIIGTYETLSSQAMTMKSKLIYPLSEPTYSRSVHFDQNADISMSKSSIPLVNTNKKNEAGVLGRAPQGTIQQAETTQLTQNFLSTYRDVHCIIDQIHRNPSRLSDDSVNPILEFYNSAFNIFDKSVIVGKKTQTVVPDLSEYSILAGFLQTGDQKNKKVIQDAPESIAKKEKLTQFDKKKNIHLHNEISVNINLPNMMNLGNIADFGIEKESFEQNVVDNNTNVIDLNADDDDAKYDQRISSVEEDINTPMDWIKNRKVVNTGIKHTSTTQSNYMEPTTYTVSSSVQSSSVAQVSSIPQVPSQVPKIPAVVSNTGPGIPLPPPMPVPTQKVAPPQVPSSVPLISAKVPPVPGVPSVPSIPSVPVVVAGGGPGVPLPPPIPMLNLTIPVLPSEPIIQPKTASTAAKKPSEARPLTMQEEIGANPMARLKKVGDIKVSEKDEPKKPPATTDLMSILKQQIHLRFKNLHKHDDDDKSDSASDY